MSASPLLRPLAGFVLVLWTFCAAGAAAATQAEGEASKQPVTMSASDKTCLAKMVMREAGNQSHLGQVAVAQVVLNRLVTGRFGNSVCAVIDQPGQFFNSAKYRPSTTSSQWRMAQRVAEAALEAENRAVVAGALFFNATRERAAWRGRRVLWPRSATTASTAENAGSAARQGVSPVHDAPVAFLASIDSDVSQPPPGVGKQPPSPANCR